MTSLEMEYMFLKSLETTSKELVISERPTTDEIFLFLNIAQDRRLYDVYLQGKSVNETIETIKNNYDTLFGLVNTVLITPAAITEGALTGCGYKIPYPNNFIHYIRSETNITRTGDIYPTNNSWVTNNLLTYDQFENNITSLFNKPILREPGIVFEKNNLTLLTDSYTTINTLGVNLTYLRKPLYLSTENSNTTTTVCELAIKDHTLIVDMAFELWLTKYKFRLKGNTDNRDKREKEQPNQSE